MDVRRVACLPLAAITEHVEDEAAAAAAAAAVVTTTATATTASASRGANDPVSFV